MNRLLSIWIIAVVMLALPCSASSAPKVLKELTGVKLEGGMRQAFQASGSVLTLAEESFIVIKPATCYGAKARRICRVALGYPVQNKNKVQSPSLKQAVALTYKNPSAPGASLTIISAIRYF